MEQGGALRQSLTDAVRIDQGMLRYVLDQSRDCIKILGPQGHVDYINSEGRCALGIDDPESVLGKHWRELWPAHSQPIVEVALTDATAGVSSEIEASRPDSKGQTRWWRVSISPLMEGDGDLVGILTISRDVTPPVTLRESEQTLVLEMRHRLRNAYTIASAIVMQSARGNAASQDFAESVCARLADVALSQARLLEAGEKTWALSDLLSTLVEAHGDGATKIRFVGNAQATVDGHRAMLIALVVGELTNNSLKHGALRLSRAVKLSWTMDGETLTLNWREPVDDRSSEAIVARSEGSGYSMMQRMARAQSATFEHSIEDGEIRVTLSLQASD